MSDTSQVGKPNKLSVLWSIIAPASVLVSLFFPIAGLIWYFFSVEARISKLENQIQLLVVSPLPKSTDTGQSASPASINPVLNTCLDLVKRLAEGRLANSSNAYMLEGYINDYGCKDIMAKNATLQSKPNP